jgi:hypothetical protein
MKVPKPSQERSALKSKILEQGIQKHQMVIDDFNQSIKEIMASGGSDERTFASSQQSLSNEAVDQANQIADQLQFAADEMKILRNMESTIQSLHETVQLGSVVVTDKDTFFVSVSIERFEVEGQPLFGLSMKSPLYKVMQSKKAGDSFTFNKRTYSIEDVF